MVFTDLTKSIIYYICNKCIIIIMQPSSRRNTPNPCQLIMKSFERESERVSVLRI